MPPDEYVDELVAIGRSHGLDRVGVTTADVLERARRLLHERRDGGLHDGMQFTYRNPDRSSDPDRAVAGARSIVVGARSYALERPARPVELAARVARYAWVDHYAELRQGLWAVAERLRADGWKAVVFADDNAIVDREVAWRAGLGWFGKNANLLVDGAGSWFVLGCVVTTAPLPAATEPVADGCGPCRRCLDACPTGAIVASGVVDAARCLAWLVQKPGVFPRQHRAALGDRIYGCDDCQDVCPPTRRWGAAHLGAGPEGAPVQAWVPVAELLTADDATLLARHGRWYVPQRDPRWLRRNALVVLGNIGDGTDESTAAILRRFLTGADPILRAHAVWAAARLGRHDLLPESDPDPDVAEELALAAAAVGPAR